MPLKIIKLAVHTNQSIATSPSVTRLFHEVGESIIGSATYKIGTSDFLNDSGEVVQRLPKLNLNNNYFNVFINGVLQMDDVFAYTDGEDGVGSLIISVPEGSEIPSGSPIIVEIVNFYPKVGLRMTT